MSVSAEHTSRTVSVAVYASPTYPENMRLSNDPLMISGVTTMPYSNPVTRTFDQRQVVWVQVEDNVGNWSLPYPAYAGLAQKGIYLPLIRR